MATVLRPYQVTAVNMIRSHAAKKGKGIIVQLPTGAGKTAVFCEILKSCYQKGKMGLMVVRGKSLVMQASKRLAREGVPHGILQGDNSYKENERILVCSIDTLYSRKMAPKTDVIVIDECHLSHSDGYYWFLENYETVFKIGVSATPFHKKGMSHIADAVINPISIKDLIAQGFLVGGRYFMPYVPNLKGVKKSNGDFNTEELAKKSISDSELTANCGKVWQAHLKGKSTLCYAVNINHATVLASELAKSGASVTVITGDASDHERNSAIKNLEAGQLDVIVSVGVLTTGVDIPSLQAILCCRPTESYNLWIQIMGRGTRPFPGKESFLLYDLSGNILRHGIIEHEQIADLDGQPASSKSGESGPKLVVCSNCFATFENIGQEICADCGAELTKNSKKKVGKRVHGLTENDQVKEYIPEPWENDLIELAKVCREKGYRKGYIYNVLKQKYSEQIADLAWPRVRALKKWPLRQQVKTAPPTTMPSSKAY